MIEKKIQNNRGFTLVETMVAIAILSLSIAATFTAVTNGIRSSTYAKDQVIAFYLVQEAMEFVRNIRDENALHSVSGADTNWLAGLSADPDDPCYFGRVCRVDSASKEIAYCGMSFGTCPNIFQDTVTGLYRYDSGTDIGFKRELQLESVSSDEVSLVIKITWVKDGVPKSFQISESLFNHQ
jgi:prepilin-type N-terminal cleavage/methylation domain-containing protein